MSSFWLVHAMYFFEYETFGNEIRSENAILNFD